MLIVPLDSRCIELGYGISPRHFEKQTNQTITQKSNKSTANKTCSRALLRC